MRIQLQSNFFFNNDRNIKKIDFAKIDKKKINITLNTDIFVKRQTECNLNIKNNISEMCANCNINNFNNNSKSIQQENGAKHPKIKFDLKISAKRSKLNANKESITVNNNSSDLTNNINNIIVNNHHLNNINHIVNKESIHSSNNKSNSISITDNKVNKRSMSNNKNQNLFSLQPQVNTPINNNANSPKIDHKHKKKTKNNLNPTTNFTVKKNFTNFRQAESNKNKQLSKLSDSKEIKETSKEKNLDIKKKLENQSFNIETSTYCGGKVVDKSSEFFDSKINNNDNKSSTLLDNKNNMKSTEFKNISVNEHKKSIDLYFNSE